MVLDARKGFNYMNALMQVVQKSGEYRARQAVLATKPQGRAVIMRVTKRTRSVSNDPCGPNCTPRDTCAPDINSPPTPCAPNACAPTFQ